MFHLNRIRLVAVVGLGLLASCSSSGTAEVVGDPMSPWVMPSPLLEEQLNDEAKKLPWAHGLERVEQIRWFASIGEPAYPKLLELVADPRDHVAAAALAALGATGDRRLVDHIQNVAWSEQRKLGNLALERARTLVRLGDWSEIPVLINGLRAERVYTRALSAKALQEATNLHFGFEARSSEEDRERAINKWQEWWNERSHDTAFTVDASAPRTPVSSVLPRTAAFATVPVATTPIASAAGPAAAARAGRCGG